MPWMLFVLLFCVYLSRTDADHIADILKFIYKNEDLCGDPFYDPQWLPAHKECAIQCDVHRQICMSSVGTSFQSQKCLPLSEQCSSAIRSLLQVAPLAQPRDNTDVFTSPFRKTPELSNVIEEEENMQTDTFTTPSGLFHMRMFSLGRAKSRPDTTTLRPIAFKLFRDPKSIFERVHPPAFGPLPPTVPHLREEFEYLNYDDNNAVTPLPVARTTTAYHPTKSYFMTDNNAVVEDNPYGIQHVTPPPFVTKKNPLGRGTLPVDLNYAKPPVMGYAEDDDKSDDERNYDDSEIVHSLIPPSPLRTASPPAPPQPPSIAPPEYRPTMLVESETNNFLSRALTLSANSKYGKTDHGLTKKNDRKLQYRKLDKHNNVRDYSSKCCEWALNGFCDRSWQKIRRLCPKSCGTIICSTTDKIQSCNRAIDVEALDCFDPVRSKAHSSVNVAIPKDHLLNSIPASTERLVMPVDKTDYLRRAPPAPFAPRMMMKVQRVDDLPASSMAHFPQYTLSIRRKPSSSIAPSRKYHPIDDVKAKVKPYAVENEMRSWSHYKQA